MPDIMLRHYDDETILHESYEHIRQAVDFSVEKLDLADKHPRIEQNQCGSPHYEPGKHCIRIPLTVSELIRNKMECILFHEMTHVYQYANGFLIDEKLDEKEIDLITRILEPRPRKIHCGLTEWNSPTGKGRSDFLCMNTLIDDEAVTRWFQYEDGEYLDDFESVLSRRPVCDEKSDDFQKEYELLPWEKHATDTAFELFDEYRKLNLENRRRHMFGSLKKYETIR